MKAGSFLFFAFPSLLLLPAAWPFSSDSSVQDSSSNIFLQNSGVYLSAGTQLQAWPSAQLFFSVNLEPLSKAALCQHSPNL